MCRQILKRCNDLKYQSRCLDTSRDLPVRRLIRYWNGVQVTRRYLQCRIHGSLSSLESMSTLCHIWMTRDNTSKLMVHIFKNIFLNRLVWKGHIWQLSHHLTLEAAAPEPQTLVSTFLQCKTPLSSRCYPIRAILLLLAWWGRVGIPPRGLMLPKWYQFCIVNLNKLFDIEHSFQWTHVVCIAQGIYQISLLI